MSSVSLKRVEVKCVCCSSCFRQKSLQNHQEVLWCCGSMLWQEEERIRGDENGQDLEICSDWGKVNGAGQGWVSFPGGRGNLLYNNV